MVRISTYLLAILMSVPLNAQSVTGRVTAEDGAPISGAHVIIEGTSIGVASNLEGRYVLETAITGPVVLTFSAVGFFREQRVLRLSAETVVELDVQLREKVILADEVVVTAS